MRNKSKGNSSRVLNSYETTEKEPIIYTGQENREEEMGAAPLSSQASLHFDEQLQE